MKSLRCCAGALALGWAVSPATAQQPANANSMSFFVTSVGPGRGDNLAAGPT